MARHGSNVENHWPRGRRRTLSRNLSCCCCRRRAIVRKDNEILLPQLRYLKRRRQNFSRKRKRTWSQRFSTNLNLHFFSIFLPKWIDQYLVYVLYLLMGSSSKIIGRFSVWNVLSHYLKLEFKNSYVACYELQISIKNDYSVNKCVCSNVYCSLLQIFASKLSFCRTILETVILQTISSGGLCGPQKKMIIQIWDDQHVLTDII